MPKAPSIVHWKDIQDADDSTYEGSTELLGISSSFAPKTGLHHLGIHHEFLPPGRRTSFPHREESEEEFLFVIEGTPDLWLDGVLHRLREGHGVSFPAGCGVSHVVINNTETPVRLMVVGEASRKRTRIDYPLNPERNRAIGERHWKDAPEHPLGPHDGLPDALRKLR